MSAGRWQVQAEDYVEEILFLVGKLLALRATVHEIANQDSSAANTRNLVNIKKAINTLELAPLDETNRTLSVRENWGVHYS